MVVGVNVFNIEKDLKGKRESNCSMVNRCESIHPFLPAAQLNGESFGVEKHCLFFVQSPLQKIKF